MSDVKKTGRPLKYAEIEEQNAVSPVVETDVVKPKLQPAFTQPALGIGQNEKGEWCLFKFKFDSMTKVIEFDEAIVERSRLGAMNKFKIVAARFLV